MSDKVQQQNPDGAWSEAQPLAYTPGIDFEVSLDGRWHMFDDDMLIGMGRNRTRLGQIVAMWRAKRAYLREVQG